jgi:hypothetical protein
VQIYEEKVIVGSFNSPDHQDECRRHGYFYYYWIINVESRTHYKNGACPKSQTSRGDLKQKNMGFTVVLYIAVIALMIASAWIVFTKAGKPGWAAIIPIYNVIVMLEIVGKPWWWILLMLIPSVNIVILIMVYHRLSLSFGKGAGFTVGLIFLSFIFLPILAFGDAKYLGPGGPPPAAPAAPQAV